MRFKKKKQIRIKSCLKTDGYSVFKKHICLNIYCFQERGNGLYDNVKICIISLQFKEMEQSVMTE